MLFLTLWTLYYVYAFLLRFLVVHHYRAQVLILINSVFVALGCFDASWTHLVIGSNGWCQKALLLNSLILRSKASSSTSSWAQENSFLKFLLRGPLRLGWVLAVAEPAVVRDLGYGSGQAVSCGHLEHQVKLLFVNEVWVLHLMHHSVNRVSLGCQLLFDLGSLYQTD
jgi:hypothetical protein